MRGEPVEALSRELGMRSRLEEWHRKALQGIASRLVNQLKKPASPQFIWLAGFFVTDSVSKVGHFYISAITEEIQQ
jgi:hypothetical protein